MLSQLDRGLDSVDDGDNIAVAPGVDCLMASSGTAVSDDWMGSSSSSDGMLTDGASSTEVCPYHREPKEKWKKIERENIYIYIGCTFFSV